MICWNATGVVTDALHRPFLGHPFIRGRYEDDPEIYVSRVFQDLHKQVKLSLVGRFQDLSKHTSM